MVQGLTFRVVKHLQTLKVKQTNTPLRRSCQKQKQTRWGKPKDNAKRQSNNHAQHNTKISRSTGLSGQPGAQRYKQITKQPSNTHRQRNHHSHLECEALTSNVRKKTNIKNTQKKTTTSKQEISGGGGGILKPLNPKPEIAEILSQKGLYP